MSLFRLPESERLAEHDPALAQRLAALLVETLKQELATPETEAARLASEVSWTVTRERDGTWLYLAHGGSVIGAGGRRRLDEDGLTLYVRQMAHHLVGREAEFRP